MKLKPFYSIHNQNKTHCTVEHIWSLHRHIAVDSLLQGHIDLTEADDLFLNLWTVPRCFLSKFHSRFVLFHVLLHMYPLSLWTFFWQTDGVLLLFIFPFRWINVSLALKLELYSSNVFTGSNLCSALTVWYSSPMHPFLRCSDTSSLWQWHVWLQVTPTPLLTIPSHHFRPLVAWIVLFFEVLTYIYSHGLVACFIRAIRFKLSPPTFKLRHV